MAVSTAIRTITYVGNGSTTTAYAITFPFLDTAHIYAAVSSDGEEDAVDLDPGDFTVTRLADGSGGTLTTVTAVTSPAEITIYRVVPITQPASLAPAGPLPAETVEDALDRLTMIAQQIAGDAGIPGGDPASAVGKTWADSAARSAVTPDFAGQLGTERDSQTIWIAQSTTVGDWEEYNPRYTAKIVLGVVSDGGDPGVNQTAAATLLGTWGPDGILFAGDNSYNGISNYSADWAAFNAFISAGTAFPALGNHELDETGWQAALDAKFPYLTNNRRYYKVTFGDGLVDLFVLNSGFDSALDLQEADGNEVDSTQYDWFVEQLAASRARWRIAMFHHPPITAVAETGRIATEMEWPELNRMDLIVCGHTHTNELLSYDGVTLLNLSALTQTPRLLTGEIQNNDSGLHSLLWGEDQSACIGRLIITKEAFRIEIHAVSVPYTTTRLLHAREVRDVSTPPIITESFLPVAEADSVPEDDTLYVHTLPAPVLVKRVEVKAVASPGAGVIDWELFAGAESLAAGSIPDGESLSIENCVIPVEMIPRSTVLTIAVTNSIADSRKGLEVTIVYQRNA